MEQKTKTEESTQDIEFSGLVLGFCSAALSYLGYGEESGQRNLALARQNMSILRMLQSKTTGNLTSDEQKLLNDAIKDLEDKLREFGSA